MNSSLQKPLAIVALVILAIPTALAFLNEGVMGFPTAIISSYASIQIYIDLVIAIAIILVWLWDDAKKSGRNPWPWVIGALIVGCFSPLIYLLTRKPNNG